MGLWLKCPGCQALNPLYFQVCGQCGQSLNNLSPGQRVYVLAPGGPTAAAAKTPAPSPEAAPKEEKKPKRPRKKKP
jgi:hypothetical protein